MPRADAVAAAWLVGALAACAARQTPGNAGPDAATTLGPVSGEGCFHVWHDAPTSYRFMVDEVEYPDGLAGGKVRIFVTAGRFVDLRPRPVELPRLRRLEFAAEGQARGPLELTLSLVDSDGRMSEPTWMNTICPTREVKR